ncbi:hypothetical protein Tco_0581185 [Tanacetum coccineum]
MRSIAALVVSVTSPESLAANPFRFYFEIDADATHSFGPYLAVLSQSHMAADEWMATLPVNIESSKLRMRVCCRRLSYFTGRRSKRSLFELYEDSDTSDIEGELHIDEVGTPVLGPWSSGDTEWMQRQCLWMWLTQLEKMKGGHAFVKLVRDVFSLVMIMIASIIDPSTRDKLQFRSVSVCVRIHCKLWSIESRPECMFGDSRILVHLWTSRDALDPRGKCVMRASVCLRVLMWSSSAIEMHRESCVTSSG